MSEQVYKFRVPTAGEVIQYVIVSSEDAVDKENDMIDNDMIDNEIKELKADYDRLVLQFADAQMKACRLSGAREKAKNTLIAKLQELFRSTNDYNCPHCGKPMTVEYSDDGKCWMECTDYDCKTEGPEFDGPLEAYLEWYRICNSRRKRFNGEKDD